MKGQKKRREETATKMLTLYYQTHSAGAQSTHFRVKQATESLLNKTILPCVSVFSLHLQIMKHKGFGGRPRGIHSMSVWRTTGKHTDKQRQGAAFLSCAWLSVWVRLQGQQESPAPEAPLKRSSLLHKYHNTEEICCVGMRSSPCRKMGLPSCRAKIFLSFCELEAFGSGKA